jgi:hypothetical protein
VVLVFGRLVRTMRKKAAYLDTSLPAAQAGTLRRGMARA